MSFPLLCVPETSGQPFRRAVRWFKSSFAQQIDAVSQATKIAFRTNEPSLTACFVEWLRPFEGQRPRAPSARQAYVGFAAGLMLRSLIRHKPVATVDMPATDDPTNPAFFWPEGYAYVSYCLNIHYAILEQDFDEHLDLAPELLDVRVWCSFKENCREDDSLAIAFLELFSWHAPNWVEPSLFNESRARQERVAFDEAPKISSGAKPPWPANRWSARSHRQCWDCLDDLGSRRQHARPRPSGLFRRAARHANCAGISGFCR